MRRHVRRRQALILSRPHRLHRAEPLRYAPASAVIILLLAFFAWPYLVLWRINQAALQADPTALSTLVDLPAVRRSIIGKLNKDTDSAIGPLSDAFIRWLEAGIAADGNRAVERLVTLQWVRDRLLSGAGDHRQGFLGEVSYAFFDAPDGFRVRIEPACGTPTQMRLRLRDLRWRVTAVYY